MIICKIAHLLESLKLGMCADCIPDMSLQVSYNKVMAKIQVDTGIVKGLVQVSSVAYQFIAIRSVCIEMCMKKFKEFLTCRNLIPVKVQNDQANISDTCTDPPMLQFGGLVSSVSYNYLGGQLKIKMQWYGQVLELIAQTFTDVRSQRCTKL